ncbi:Lreu_0056 family protein [Lactobacillus kefiranofaciens]|uniref:Lreu_0056 family protein n=1 Tax=Lactobacillus kefiranofaciens TaxID=267818 RepID=UPI0036F23E86
MIPKRQHIIKTAYYIDGHGDPTTIVEFKREGDILITKHNDLTGQSVGNSPMITKRIPLMKLVEKYYSTDDEKAEVDNLANSLLTQQQYDAKLKAASNK